MIYITYRKGNKMKNYKAVVTEKTSSNFGKTFANTKTPNTSYKGMNKQEFTEAIKYNQCFSFEVVEIC